LTDPRVHGRFESRFVDPIAQESDTTARVTAARRIADLRAELFFTITPSSC